MEELKSPLLELPLEILNEITKHFDLRTVCIFRKTCRQLCHYVDNDNVPFDLKLVVLKCSESYSALVFQFEFCEHSSLDFEIRYKTSIGGCRVEYRQRDCHRRKFVGNAVFLTVAGNDLGLILRHQKSELRTLEMSGIGKHNGVRLETAMGIMLNSLEPHLENRTLSIDDIQFSYLNQEHLMKILPHLSDDGYSIRLYDSEPVDIDLIVNSEEWKDCSGWNSGEIRNIQLDKFHHFEKAHFGIDQVSSNEVFLLKEAKLQDPYFQFIEFKYKHLSDPRNLKKLLGQPYDKDNGYERWYFRIPNHSDRALKIKRNPRRHEFDFSMISMAYVPDGALDA